MAQKHIYQHHVINDSLNDAIDRVSDIISTYSAPDEDNTHSSRR
jgi:hypothetical protein